jgi:hypothetical protein
MKYKVESTGRVVDIPVSVAQRATLLAARRPA